MRNEWMSCLISRQFEAANYGPTNLMLFKCSLQSLDSTKLHEMLRQPFDMFRPGYADSFIMGLVNQFAQVMDEGVTDQVISATLYFDC